MKVDQLLKHRKTIVVFGGRFQPFHAGHYEVYKNLVNTFGKYNVWICSSNKQEFPNSPFSFNEKKLIATTMFDVPKSRFVKVQQPYKPTEILSKFNPEKDIYITVISEKDADRFTNHKYFQDYKDSNELKSFREHGYVFIVPVQHDNISASYIRKGLSNLKTLAAKMNFFKQCYGKFEESIFNLINDKLQS